MKSASHIIYNLYDIVDKMIVLDKYEAGKLGAG